MVLDKTLRAAVLNSLKRITKVRDVENAGPGETLRLIDTACHYLQTALWRDDDDRREDAKAARVGRKMKAQLERLGMTK